MIARIFLALSFSLVIQYAFSQQFYIRGRVSDGENQQPLKEHCSKGGITRNMFINGQPPSGAISSLRLLEESVLLSEKGILLTPIRVFYDGIWSYERLANMLPEDYGKE